MTKPIEQFADYNRENVLGNILQAETHLKNVQEDTDPNYLSCINKHLLESQAELAELQAHEPEHQNDYRDLMVRLRKLRKDNIRGISIKEAISRLRGIRSDFEKYVPGHDVEECRSCGDMAEKIRNFSGATKSLNRGGTQNLNIENREDFMAKPKETKTVMQALGGNVGAEVVDRYVSSMVPALVPGITGKQLGNLGIGIGLTALSLYGKLKKANLAGAVAGTNLIAKEVMNMVGGAIAPPPAVARAVVTNAAPRNAVAGKTLEVYPYGTVTGAAASNGGLVFID